MGYHPLWYGIVVQMLDSLGRARFKNPCLAMKFPGSNIIFLPNQPARAVMRTKRGRDPVHPLPELPGGRLLGKCKKIHTHPSLPPQEFGATQAWTVAALLQPSLPISRPSPQSRLQTLHSYLPDSSQKLTGASPGR